MTYDFKDYDPAGDGWRRLQDLFFRVEKFVEKASSRAIAIQEKGQQDALREAFRAYADEGGWQIWVDGDSEVAPGRLGWVPKIDSEHWPDEFPVRLEVRPADWAAAARHSHTEDYFDAGDAPTFRRVAAELRAAADEMDAIARELEAAGDGQDEA